jgi:alkylation response protein AidB-like acyl-CoA dehydrogenase
MASTAPDSAARDSAARNKTARDGAATIAGELLFPAAMATDVAIRIPPAHLDALAAAGLYGLAGPAAAGGLGADIQVMCDVTEILAGGCLATTFVWLQHHRAVRAVAATPDKALREAWLTALCRGDRRSGIALGGALPHPVLRARPVAGGYLLDGTSPWVTGWGMIDTLYTVARTADDRLVTALLDAQAGPTLAAEQLALVAVNASCTVELRFEDHFVPADRVVEMISYRDWLTGDARGLRMNGSLSLGVAARCCALAARGAGAAGQSPLDIELAQRRAELDAATAPDAAADAMPRARAAAAEFVLRAAGALVAATGSRAVLAAEHPQRLAREALFLLVFGSRPAIKRHLTELLTTARPRPS